MAKRVIVTLAVVFAAVLSVGFAVNRANSDPLIEMKMVYVDNPAYFFNDMQLVWGDTVYREIAMAGTGRGKEIGYATDESSTWRIYELKGYGCDYLLAAESEDVWRVMCSLPPNELWRQYILEDTTEKQRMEHMLSLTLYTGGTARLTTPPFSSFALELTFYSFVDDELLIHYENDDVIARFEVIDDNTLVFKESCVPLYAEEGTRYVTVPLLTADEMPSPELTLYQGVPADPSAANPIAKDETGRYPLVYTISAVVRFNGDTDLSLYFDETGTNDTPIPVPFPIEKNTGTHAMRIDVGNVFPNGFSGHVWAVATYPDGTERYSEIMNVIY